MTEFQALLAPLTVDSQDLQQAVFEAGIPDEMLEGVADAGVQPIAVLPGPMRKMLGVDHAFMSPADFDGQVVGLQDSAESEETLVALGATTKALPGGANISGVDGYEQQLASIVGNAYFNVASFVTANLNWWPRPLVVVANQESYDDLTDEQRDALATATERSFTAAMDASRAEDADAVGELCVEDMQLVEASADQLAALIQAVRPVHDRLEADAHSAQWLEEIEQLKADLGAPPDTADCASQEPEDAGGVLPDGTYRTTLTKEAVLSGCQPGDLGAENLLPGVVDKTLELDVSGNRIVETEYPVGRPDERVAGWQGTYRTFRHTFELLEVGSDVPLPSTFDFDGTTLLLTDMQTEYCDHQTVWTGHPWKLVAPVYVDELEGTWTTELTAADAGGIEEAAGTYTLTFAHGRVKLTQPDGMVGYRAHYDTFRGSLVTTESVDELHMSYRVDGDTLYLTDLSIPGTDDAEPYVVTWTSHPWTRRQL